MRRRRLNKKGLLFVLSAPSGCGKTTVCKRLTAIFPRLSRSVSATTRPPRKNEVNGRDYYFVSGDEFRRMRKKGELLEWAPVFGYFYGTPKAPVNETLNRGEDMLLAIDVKGAGQVKKKAPRSVHIFLAPPSMDDLRKRLKKRGTDRLLEIKKRLDVARGEMAQAKRYDYIVVNDALKEAVGRIESIMRSEKRK